jgi:hypothetical protein
MDITTSYSRLQSQVVKDGSCKSTRCQSNQHPATTMSTEGESSAAELPDKKEISLAAKRKKRGQSKQKAPNEDSDSVPGRSSSSSSRRKRIASIRGAANVATEDSDFDPAEERPKKAAKRRKTKKGGKSNYLCSHCEKSFTSEGGLKYHVGESLLKVFSMIDLPVFLSYILILIFFQTTTFVEWMRSRPKETNGGVPRTKEVALLRISDFVENWKIEPAPIANVSLPVHWV